MCDMDYLFKPIVLVTGFGPFLDHSVNASWEAVKLINKDEIEKKYNVELVTLEMPVTYGNVDEFVPALWETHTPKLMIHVGLANLSNKITIEAQAHRKGYQRLDYFDQCPANNVCTAEGAIRIHTKLDVERICKEFNENNPPNDTVVITSRDAGRYLCEYIYYTSLSVDNTRTLLIHVPNASVYSSKQTASALDKILDLCLDQITEMDSVKDVTEKLQNTTLDLQNNL